MLCARWHGVSDMPGGMVYAACCMAGCMMHGVWQVYGRWHGVWQALWNVARERTAHLEGKTRAQPALQLGRCDVPAGHTGRCATVAESRILPIRPHNTHTHLDPRPRGGQHALPSCRAVPYMHKHSDPAPPFRACCARSGACAVVGVRCSCTHSTAVHAPVAVDVQRGEALPQPLKVDRLHRAAQHGRSLG